MISSLEDIAAYQRDAETALRLYFSARNPDFAVIFAGYKISEVAAMLVDMLNETGNRSSLIVLARIEAAFYLDYKERCKSKLPDSVSIQFRKIAKRKGANARPRLEDEIWGVWRDADPAIKQAIGQLRSAFKFRHWLAHGRYWNMGNQYDFQTLYTLADGVLSGFPLRGL